MPLIQLEPARLDLADPAAPASVQFDDIYHSRDGGPEQCRQVFLAGNELPGRWQQRERFVVLETGFGLGLNFLTTWAAWREDPARCGTLHFVSLEKHPLRREDLQQVQRQWPALAELAGLLAGQWPMLTPGSHRLVFDHGQVVLTLVFDDVLPGLKNLSASVDAIFLDGFAPAKNPDMWSPAVCRALARLAKRGTTLATYTVAAAVRDGLSQAGFVVEKQPGFGHKAAMLRGQFRVERDLPAGQPGSALVLGAGLAGCSIAAELAARGIAVTLLERLPGPAQATSGNWAGCYLPLPSLDDNLTSRLVRAGFLAVRQQLARLQQAGINLEWAETGVVQMAKDDETALQQQQIAQALAMPAEFGCLLDAAALGERAGVPLPAGGWWFVHGGWVRPASLCAALLQQAGPAVDVRYGVNVAGLAPSGCGWQALAADGATLASADVVILANSIGVPEVWPAMEWPLSRIRGQIDYLLAGCLPAFGPVLCREGYVLPVVDGVHVVGASFDFRNQSPALSEASAAGNRQRLQQLLPQLDPAASLPVSGGRVGLRCVSGDRMPLVGAVPDVVSPQAAAGMSLAQLPRVAGLYSLTGIGSRGLVWAGLCAGLLADRLVGDPARLEQDLIDAIDPARFWLRQLRRGAA